MKNPTQLEDFCQYRFLSGLKFNNDADKLAFVVSSADMKENKYRHNIYCYDVETKETKRLTGLDNERNFVWENNHTLLFVADRDGKTAKAVAEGSKQTSYYRLDLNGGEAIKAFTLDLTVSAIKFIDEDRLLVLASDKLDEIKVTDEESKNNWLEEKDYEVIDELPFWFNGRGFINKIRSRLYLYNLKDNTSTLLTTPYYNVHDWDLTADKKSVIVTGNSYTDMDSQFCTVLSIDLETKEIKELIEEKYSIGSIAIVNDYVLLTASDLKTWGTSENRKLYKLNLLTNEFTCLLDKDLSFGSSVGSDAKLYGGTSYCADNDRLVFTLTTDNCSNVYCCDLEGNLTQLTDNEGSVDCFAVKNGKLFFIGMRNLQLQEIYEVCDCKEQPVTKINTYLDTVEVLPLNKLSFVDSDGVRIDGWVIEPRNYDPNKKYPAVFDIHGGPKTAYGETFFHEMQYWASNDYFVFFCNPRGSDGRGNEFMNLVNKYGTVDYSDLMEFNDLVLKQYPAIDEKRVAVTGGSYGGFMTNWIIGHTDRYCCAASQRSISNWLSKSLATDIGYYHNMSQMAATPWTNMERMWSFSPLKYADKCVTPTLFIQSDEDYRCWMADAIQMFEALKLHGCEARMCLFHGENHELSRSGKPKHRRRRLSEITNWFDKYAK